ncbi:hypothetical protein KY289_030620 [Solanum tuberosum]|nr:hypothetical protein KY289_030620 [Solanum tuberosum]
MDIHLLGVYRGLPEKKDFGFWDTECGDLFGVVAFRGVHRLVVAGERENQGRQKKWAIQIGLIVELVWEFEIGPHL